MPHPTTSPQDLTTIIQKTLNDDIIEFLPVQQGLENEVYNLKTKQGLNVFVRIKQKGTTDFGQEAWAMQKAKSLGVPVPHIFAVESFEIAGELKEVMVLQKAEGKSLAELQGSLSHEALQKIFVQFGSVMRELHSYKINSFGALKENNQWEFLDWQAYLQRILQKREQDVPYLEQAGLSKLEAEKMLAVVKEMKPFESVLCHGDVSFEHLFIDEDLKLTAFVDWGLCQAGSPALDVAMLLMYHPDIELSWIVQGYELAESEQTFRREMLIQQANVMMSFLGYDMREGNCDYQEIAVQGMRHLLKTWESL